MIRKIVKLILIICWMGIIFSFSSDTGEVSTKKSDGLIIKVIEKLSGHELSEKEKIKWTTYLVVPVRKGAHLAVYLILGLLIYSFITEFISINYKSILLSVGITFLYACTDEVHQMFVSGRSGQISDVFLDVIGAFIGIGGYYLILRRRKKHE